jgi:glyoxylase-like metal-dependent hydrolase (beta-lactamase superfamily II)
MPTLKLPRPIFSASASNLESDPNAFASLYAFPPNRETLGGTAYFLKLPEGNILVDCPAWDEATQTFLQEQGGVRSLFLTHRSGISQSIKLIQQQLDCDLIIQEQEAYLLPGMRVTTFQTGLDLAENCEAIWTAGHSPGSACLYDARSKTLLTGRHILPDRQGNPTPLRTAKTFHWRRQIENVQRLVTRFDPETLQHICPGANTGFLRGERYCDRAHAQLSQLDFAALMQMQPLL